MALSLKWSCWCFVLLCQSCAFGLEEEEFMPGAVPLREPDNLNPIMYTSVIPLMYRFRMPVWDKTSMKIQFWKEHNNCTESDDYQAGYPCPVMFHMNEMIDSFTKNITSWKNLLHHDYTHSSNFLLDPSILWDKEICTKLEIRPHFSSSQASSEQLQKYLEVLTQCAERNGTVFNKIVEDMSNLSVKLESQYHDTFASFTADYWGLLEQINGQAASVVAWTALQTTLMLHQYTETQRWTQAVQSCQRKEVPWTLISSLWLYQTLEKLRENYLEAEYQDYAIPLDEISKYFKLPLTDCIFGEDGTFVVRILVPVVPEQAQKYFHQNHFVRYHPVPFIASGEEGDEGKKHVCQLWGGEKSVPFNPGMNGVLPCSCSKSDLFCKFESKSENQTWCPAPTIKQTELDCLLAISSDIEEDIVKHCPLECKTFYDNKTKELEVIIDSTTRIIPTQGLNSNLSSNSSNSTYIQCLQHKPSSISAAEVKWEPVGAYQVNLPKGCSVIQVLSNQNNSNSLSNMVIAQYLPGVRVKHLMPYHWRNGISITSASEESTEESGENGLQEPPTVTGMVEKMSGVESKITFLAGKLQQLDEACGVMGGGVYATESTLLWLLIMLSLIINIILGVMVLQLHKWKKELKVKSDRMVYNVTASEEDDFPIQDSGNMRNPLCSTSNRTSSNDL